MKQKWLELNIGQKVIFCIQLVLIVLFILLYSTVGKQQIVHYRDTTLRCKEMDSATVYSGKLDGTRITFLVQANQVEYRYADKTVLYTVTEDPSAIPAREDFEDFRSVLYEKLSGVEVRKDEELLFRGAWMSFSDTLFLYNEDGSTASGTMHTILSPSGAVLSDPSAATILRLMYAPNVAQRANVMGLLGGIFLCVLCMISLLYADRLFRWNLRFSIRNAEDAEPSDWELFSRWVGWLIFTGMALFLFILGLTGM